MSQIARVFPRRTRATPDDALAFTGGPGLFPPDVDAVHVSVAFTWDIPRAERLAEEWRHVAPVSLGGPATGTRGEDFVPGQYIKPGYVITSRGCPNRCWFCSVPKRDGAIRELSICDGWNVLDDNLLACSEAHIRAVFAMLARQARRVEFTGGLEAARLRDWHVHLLAGLKAKPACFFAYDTADDWEPLVSAARRMLDAGFTRTCHRLRCYVLIGYPKDTRSDAERRLESVWNLGLTPMAMLWRHPQTGEATREWRRFQRWWARPAAIHARMA